MAIAGTMLGDANFKDLTVKVRMPVALIRKWKLGNLETTAAFAFAFCMGIGNDLDSDYVDVGKWARAKRCPLNLVDSLPNLGESWVFACSKGISYFPGILTQEREASSPASGETPEGTKEPAHRNRPIGRIGQAVLLVLGLVALGIVVLIVEKVVGTNSEGVTVSILLVIGLVVLGHLLRKANV